MLGRSGAQRLDRLGDNLGRRAGNEHRLGMRRGEPDPSRRGTRLKQHRGALRRRFAQERPWDAEVAPLVLDVAAMTKLINANFAAMRSPGLASKIAVPAKQKFLQDLIDAHFKA